METIKSRIESILPGESSNLDNLDDVEIESKYIAALEPNPDQVSLQYHRVYHRFLPAQLSLCVVCGYGESSRKYMLLAGYMALKQVEVHLIDPRCYGYSTGMRRSTTVFEMQRDVNVLIQQANPGLPCFIFAHSLGALVVSTILINSPDLKISGVVLSAPFFQVSPGLGASFSDMLMGAIRPLLKNTVIKTRSTYESRTTELRLLKHHLDYENTVSTFNFDYGLSILQHANCIMKEAPKFKFPVLLCHGDLDIYVKACVIQQFADKCSSIDKTIKVLPGARHEILCDVPRYEFLEVLFEWVSKRTGEPLGEVGIFEVGVAGLPKPAKWPKYLFVLSLALCSSLLIKKKLLKYF